MNEEMLERKILDYISNIMLPKMPNGVNKFLSYVGIGAVSTDPHKTMAPYIDVAKKFNIIDENGNVDISKIETALNYAFDNMHSISFMGFTFTKSDVDSFINYINT